MNLDQKIFDLFDAVVMVSFIVMFWVVGYVVFDASITDTMEITYPFFIGLGVVLIINNLHDSLR